METFGYSVLEGALARVFKLSPEAQVGVLRGRVVHLRRNGFGPQEAGRGKRIEYDYETADKWLVALALEDAGLAPLPIMGMIASLWDPAIAEAVARARRSKTDLYLAISYSELRDAAGQGVFPNIMTATPRQASKLLSWLSDEKHLTIFNLSALLKLFDEALADAPKSGGG